MRLFYIFLLMVAFGIEGMAEEKINLIKVTITGSDNLSKEKYYGAVGAKKTKWYEAWKRKGAFILQENPQLVQDATESYLKSEGFYQAKVTVTSMGDGVNIDVHEGRPVVISQIKIDSNYDLSKLVTFEKGERFKADKFVKIKSDIKRELLESGYCHYKFKTKAYIDTDAYDVTVEYGLDKGELCYFGDTSFKGQQKNVSTDVLKSRLRYRRGDLFDTRKIDSSIAVTNNLDIFETVSLSPADDQNSSVINMELVATPKEKLSVIKVGVGYDTSVGPRAQFFYDRMNFLGGARKLSLGASVAKKEKKVELSLFSPAVIDIGADYLDSYTNLGYSSSIYDTYDSKSGYLNTKLGYEHDNYYFYAGLGLENIDIVKTGYDPAIIDGSFRLFYPFLEFVYDGRDSKVDPKNGYYFSAYGEYGLQNDNESSKYTKFLLEGRAIKSFGELTLSAVGKVGVIDLQNGALPASKLFYAGGVYSNRAYGEHDIGIVESDYSSSSLGGRSWANLSLEANYKLKDDIYGAVFWDASMINGGSYDFSGEVIHAVGVGMRYKTQFGPIKIDLGVNPNHTSDYGIHFQIGQSF